MSPPDRLPLRVFLDRSVGTKSIAQALRSLGVNVQTMPDRYGAEAPSVPDTRWIENATADDRVLIGADKRIRYRTLERLTICRFSARCFTFPRGDLTAAEMIERLTMHLPDIARHAASPGPYVFHLGADRLVRMTLDCSEFGGSAAAE